jgi:hypothetical protein
MCEYLVMCLDTFSSSWSRSCVFNYKVNNMFIPEYECVKSRVRNLAARKNTVEHGNRNSSHPHLLSSRSIPY